jgi:hypothetical protein
MATTQRRWFPASREARYLLITKTTAFMDAGDNRIRIGYGPGTPNGVWYDSVYVPKLTAYNQAYRTWANPATSTRIALDNLKDAEKSFFPLYRKFYAVAKASPLVSGGDLEQMSFPLRHAGGRSPHPVDRIFIDLIVKPLGNLVLSAAFVNRDTGSSVIPYYLSGAVIYYAVSDTPAVNQNELPYARLATRSPLELIFNPEQRGKTVYLAARWQNGRGELGPWSEIVSAIIP